MVAAKRHDRAEFLDLDISVERSQVATRTDLKLRFRPFCKPGNAHAYLPFTSFHMLDIPSEDGYWRSYSDS